MIRFELKHYQQVTSTNEVAKELARQELAAEGTVILADFQTSGRGRGINSWNSESGKNMLISILFKPKIKASLHFLLNEFISLAIIDTLKMYNAEGFIKWPNDIYLDDCKLAGLLIENVIMGDTLEQSITGIGLNLNQTHFPPELPNAISLSKLLNLTIDRNVFLDRLLGNVALRYQQMQDIEHERLHREYLQHSYRLGCEIEYFRAGSMRKGILQDIRPQGEIVIRTPDNLLEQYHFGEIRIRI